MTIELNHLLGGAHSEVENFRSALVLMDYSVWAVEEIFKPYRDTRISMPDDVRDRFAVTTKWPTFAGQTCVHILYQFQDALAGTIAHLENFAQLKGLYDVADAQAAMVLFEKHFPQWKQTRHAMAHSSEISRNIEKNQHNGALTKGPIFKPKGAGLLLKPSMIGRTLTTTRKGEMLKFDVTWESYEKLLAVYDVLTAHVKEPPLRQQPDQTDRQS